MADTENTLILETTQGPVTIEMRPDLAPGHVARIKELVREGFYDGIVFHRVIDGFMAQTGCPQGTGTGGSGKKLKAEFNKEPHVRGTTSMARAASPDSGDSQFFICFDDASFLNNQYTVWGKVTSGMENVDKIKRGEPVQNPDKIVKARMAPTRRDANASSFRGVRSVNPESRDSGFRVFARPGMTLRPLECTAPCAPISSTSNFPPPASRCARRARAIPRGCWWCSPSGVCATAIVGRSAAMARARRPAGRQRHQGDRRPSSRAAASAARPNRRSRRR